MAYNNREQVEKMIEDTNKTIVPIGTSGRSFKVGKLNMSITMRPGKCVYAFIRRYFEQKANLHVIERCYRENQVGYDHTTVINQYNKKTS